MPRLAACLALFAILFSPLAPAAKDDGWVIAAKARSAEDISLWTRTIPGASLKAFRGSMHTDAPLESVAALLYDMRYMCDWIFRCKEARFVGTAENGDSYIYLAIKGIWPVGDRDAVLRVTPVWDTATGALTLKGVAAPDRLPEVDGYVRIPAIESSWRVTPVTGGLMHIEMEGHVDPAGYVPLWLANTVVTLVPRFTLHSVRELLRKPGWRQPSQVETGAGLLRQMKRGEKPSPRTPR